MFSCQASLDDHAGYFSKMFSIFFHLLRKRPWASWLWVIKRRCVPARADQVDAQADLEFHTIRRYWCHDKQFLSISNFAFEYPSTSGSHQEHSNSHSVKNPDAAIDQLELKELVDVEHDAGHDAEHVDDVEDGDGDEDGGEEAAQVAVLPVLDDDDEEEEVEDEGEDGEDGPTSPPPVPLWLDHLE